LKTSQPRLHSESLSPQEAEIRRIMVPSQLGQIVVRPNIKKKSQKRAGGVAQGIGPEFKPQYLKKKKNQFVTSLFVSYMVQFLSY
jgi:hypothetical protein